MTQLADHVNIKSISQLLKGISRVLQKLVRYFGGKGISTSLVLLSEEVLPVIFTLKVNDYEVITELRGTFL